MKSKLTATQLSGLLAIHQNPTSGWAPVHRSVFNTLAEKGLIKPTEGSFSFPGGSCNHAVLPTAAGMEIIKDNFPPTMAEVIDALHGKLPPADVARRLKFHGKTDEHFPRVPVYGLAA